MQRLAGIVPQPWRLRLWLARQYFTHGAFRLRHAQPSRRRRAAARIALARRPHIPGRGVERLSSVHIVNLAADTERLASSMAEMQRLGMTSVRRFDAVEHENGALGCALSHLACLEQMLANNWSAMMVCEDDVQFLVDRRRLDVLLDAFLDDAEADVACLAYFVWQSRPHNKLYLRGLSVQTTACYVLKRRVAEALLAVWKDGATRLARGEPAGRYACDRSWMPLQQERVFLIPVPRVARQRGGYSNVERRHVAYSH